MARVLISQTPENVGRKVLLKGWVDRCRDHGQIVFLDLRDRSGLIQLVGTQDLAGFHPEDVVEVTGLVKQRPSKTVNPKLTTGQLEIEVDSARVLAPAATLPFDLSQPQLDLELKTLFDYRSLVLRHPRLRAIFKVQEAIINAFRQKLTELQFTEFSAPTLVPVATEGGSEVFPVKYFGRQVYLGQSPQLYKQMMVSIFERVFAVARAYRAEPSVTTRHLTEYISLDAEMGFIDSWTEIMDTVEVVVRFLLAEVGKNCAAELSLLNRELPVPGESFPRLKLSEAQEIIFKRTGRDNRDQPDLEPEDEREICRWSRQEKGTDFVFVTHYPTKKRPFYTFPDPENPDLTLSFDLIGTGFEWLTGGQRINRYDQLVANIKKWGNRPEDFAMYLQAFEYGMPPEGGFALGAERVTQGMLGLENVKEASLFPRDMERVDVRLSTLHPRPVSQKKK